MAPPANRTLTTALSTSPTDADAVVDQGPALAVDPDDLVIHQPSTEIDVVVHGVEDQTTADPEIGKGRRWWVHVAADRAVEDGLSDRAGLDESFRLFDSPRRNDGCARSSA